MGTLLYFCETALLWIVSIFFLLGMGWRLFFFLLAVFRGRRSSRHTLWQRFQMVFYAFLPLHRVVLKKPVYATLRYAFHLCLVMVPVWFSGHINLWEESSFEWYWTPLPDAWADWMTLAVLGACAFFILKRMVLKNRFEARASDFVLIAITGLPFLSGYFLTHDTLSDIVFFENYLWYVHVISGEIMLVTIVFLFCRTRLNKETCVGCAACVENCSTETLEFYDGEVFRCFNYSHYQCICCGSCVNVCPEKAAGLHHELHPANLIQTISKSEIRRVELKACEQCGVRFGPIAQLDKLNRSLHRDELEIGTLDLCPRCKKLGSRTGGLTRDIDGLAIGPQ